MPGARTTAPRIWLGGPVPRGTHTHKIEKVRKVQEYFTWIHKVLLEVIQQSYSNSFVMNRVQKTMVTGKHNGMVTKEQYNATHTSND